MVCKNCGEEVKAGKRFCTKCGMPMVDFASVPEAEEVEDVKSLGKKVQSLRSAAKAEKEALDEKREESRKKREEERKKEEEALAMARKLAAEEDCDDDDELKGLLSSGFGSYSSDEDEEEELLDGFDEEEEEDIDEDESESADPYDVESVNTEESDIEDSLDSDEIIEEGCMRISDLLLNKFEYVDSDVHFSINGTITYMAIDGKTNTFSVSNGDSDIECKFIMDDRDVYEFEYVSYTKDEIFEMLESMNLCDSVIVTGCLKDDSGSVYVDAISINGPDYYIGE